MKGIKIVSSGRALPKRIVTNDDMAELVDTNDEWIRSRTGIGQRYKCEEETCTSLAIAAATEAIKKAGIDKEKIGAVLVATSSADLAFPSIACLIQKECQLSEEIIAFDISAACTGFLMGLATAQGLLQSMKKKYVLLVGCERLSGILDYSDRSSCILFGDGAGACVLTLGDDPYIQKSWSRGNESVLFCQRSGAVNHFLQMKGNDVFKFAVTALEQAMEEVLKEAKLTLDDIDQVVCHQANLRIIHFVQKKYKGYEDKFYINIDKYGNTSAASIPIAIDELLENKQIQKRQRLLLVGFGAGLTWSGTIVEV